MGIRGCALRIGVIFGLLASVPILAQESQLEPQDNQQKRELRAINRLISAIEDGQAAPNDLSMEWARLDVLMKVPDDSLYMPFAVTIDPSGITAKELTVYWRVVANEASTPAGAPASGGRKPGPFPYEDMTISTVAPAAPRVIRRYFTVPAGEYDVHVIVKELSPEDDDDPAPKVSYITHSVTVPDYWNEELATSSVVIAERVEPLAAPLTPQQQAERPYALGAMEIVPATDPQFSTADFLQTWMLIYNAKTDAQNKPDVTVDYEFYVTQDGGEKFFNRTNPQALNAQTLPPQFDITLHQLQSAQEVPLSSFPAGDYRLEIKVTDKLANKSLTREVNFSITGS